MKLLLDKQEIDDYSNLAQKIRVMTEGWVNRRTKVLTQFVEVH